MSCLPYYKVTNLLLHGHAMGANKNLNINKQKVYVQELRGCLANKCSLQAI